MNEQFGAAQKLGCPKNERFGAVQKLWLFASKRGTARLFESKIPRERPSFEPASPLRSPRLKSVHAWPAPSKES